MSRSSASTSECPFAEIADRFLQAHGYRAYQCASEQEARTLAASLPAKGQWPVYFTPSDTSGEKKFEEFYTGTEILDMASFDNIGVIKNELAYDPELLRLFEGEISEMLDRRAWTKADLVGLFRRMLPEFAHMETGKFLDGKM